MSSVLDLDFPGPVSHVAVRFVEYMPAGSPVSFVPRFGFGFSRACQPCCSKVCRVYACRQPTEVFSERSLCEILQCLPVVLYGQVPTGSRLKSFQSVLCFSECPQCSMTGRHWKTQSQNSEKISVGYLQEPVSKPYCNMTGRHRKNPHNTP